MSEAEMISDAWRCSCLIGLRLLVADSKLVDTSNVYPSKTWLELRG